MFGFFEKKESGRDAIERRKRQLIDRSGPWTAHNIALGHGVTTMDIDRNYDTAKLERCMATLERRLKRAWRDVRALDLACLEGMYSIAMAEKGATVLGIDAREINLQKANFAKEILRLQNLSFIRDDVRNLRREKYGRFEIVLMNGILYHIDRKDQLSLLKSAAAVCNDILYLDTHVALTPDATFVEDGIDFEGTEWQEFEETTTLAEREKMLWASWENPKSFKFSLSSLKKALTHVGFMTIEELPKIEEQPKDRFVFVARKQQ